MTDPALGQGDRPARPKERGWKADCATAGWADSDGGGGWSRMSITASSSELKGFLIKEMRSVLTPQLETMGFRRQRAPKRGGFPTRYYRIEAGVVDSLWFQWDKYGRPAFIINFNIIEHLDTLSTFPKKGSERWFDESRYRAQVNRGFIGRWFKIGLLGRMLCPRAVAKSVIQKASARLNDINAYMLNGVPTAYLTDMRTLGRARPRPAREGHSPTSER